MGITNKQIQESQDVDPAYINSTISVILKKRIKYELPLKLAFLDIDGTMTGDSDVILQTRKKINELGYLTIFNTSRTEELVMSSESYTKSINAGFLKRPKPLMAEKNGERIYKNPEKTNSRGLLDPYCIISSTGTKIYLQQSDGSYMQDMLYERKMQYPLRDWRTFTLEVLDDMVSQGIQFSLATIEDEKNYKNRISDVYPPEYRIQINFSNEDEKEIFSKTLSALQKDTKISDIQREKLKNIRQQDESMYCSEDYSLYLTPYHASKAQAVDHVIGQLCDHLYIPGNKFFIFFAGNTLPDLEMGLTSGATAKRGILLIPGGSCLAKPFIEGEKELLEEELEISYTKKPELGKGFYEFSPTDSMDARYVINGDECFPYTKEAETVLYAVDHIDLLLDAD